MNWNTRGKLAYVCIIFIIIQSSRKLLLLDQAVETRVVRSEHDISRQENSAVVQRNTVLCLITELKYWLNLSHGRNNWFRIKIREKNISLNDVWDLMLHSLVDRFQHFKEACFLHL
jgi:hypothetical protein